MRSFSGCELRSWGKSFIDIPSLLDSDEIMKAELVHGRLVKVENDTVTLEIKKGSYDVEEVQYELGIELDEGWVADNLGKYLSVAVVDGKVKGFPSE